MAKRVKIEELVELIRQCFREALPSRIHPKNGIDVRINSIFATVEYDFKKNNISAGDVETVLKNFEKSLATYSGNNLFPVKIDDNKFIVRIEYDILD